MVQKVRNLVDLEKSEMLKAKYFLAQIGLDTTDVRYVKQNLGGGIWAGVPLHSRLEI